MKRMVVSPFGPDAACIRGRCWRSWKSPFSIEARSCVARRPCARSLPPAHAPASGIDQDLEPAPEHALAVERHRLRVHHLRYALVLHDLGVDAVAMRSRLVHD